MGAVSLMKLAERMAPMISDCQVECECECGCVGVRLTPV